MLLALTLALATIAGAADDPAGWTAAKWGMTTDQVRAAIPDAVPLTGREADRKIDGHLSPLGVPQIKLGPATVAGYFLFDASGKLESVAFKADQVSTSATMFVNLSLALAEKYGRPMESTEGKNRTAQWTFPTTTIDLRYTEIPAIGFQTLWLTYHIRTPSRL
jgi:hypothetical protein